MVRAAVPSEEHFAFRSGCTRVGTRAERACYGRHDLEEHGRTYLCAESHLFGLADAFAVETFLEKCKCILGN